MTRLRQYQDMITRVSDAKLIPMKRSFVFENIIAFRFSYRYHTKQPNLQLFSYNNNQLFSQHFFLQHSFSAYEAKYCFRKEQQSDFYTGILQSSTVHSSFPIITVFLQYRPNAVEVKFFYEKSVNFLHSAVLMPIK